MDMHDYGPDIDDDSHITLRDRLDQLRVWWRYNVTHRTTKGRRPAMHMSRVKNEARQWSDMAWFLKRAVVMCLIATVAFALIGISRGWDASYYWRLASTMGIADVFAITLWLSARRRAHVPSHTRLWIANLHRAHIHTGTCNCQPTARSDRA